MATHNRPVVSLYVDRSSQQWIVRDAEGMFWVVPAGDDGWSQRQPIALTEEHDLEPVPRHYSYLLGVPG